jgi:hypothetical protein
MEPHHGNEPNPGRRRLRPVPPWSPHGRRAGIQTTLTDGAFEIRDYPSLVVAEVTVPGGQKEAANAGFRLLADYIFGGNSGKASIAMTAPVEQEPAGEKIAMTAPVTQTESAGAWVVRSMPSAYTLDTCPRRTTEGAPSRTPPARFAVVRFSGVAQPGLVAEDRRSRGVDDNGRLRAARSGDRQYNPPWTPGFCAGTR